MMKAQGRPESIKHASEQVRTDEDEMGHGGTFQEETTSNLVLYGRGRETVRWEWCMAGKNVEEKGGDDFRGPGIKSTPTRASRAVGGGEGGCAGGGEGRGERRYAQWGMPGFRSLGFGR